MAKVKKAIEELQKLDPDEEIIIAWWDKELIQSWYTDRLKITKTIWKNVVKNQYNFSIDYVADCINDFVNQTYYFHKLVKEGFYYDLAKQKEKENATN